MALDCTYSGLLASAADWLHRTDLTALIPDLVTMTEEAVNYGDDTLDIAPLRTADQETIWTSTSSVPAVCVAASNYVILPADFVDMRQLFVYDSAGIKNELKRTATMPLFQSDRANITGVPQWYFVSKNQLYLIPQPSSAFVLHGIYYGTVGPLATQLTNWLMSNHPRVYLFGTCMYASPWLGTDNRLQLWASGFKGAINGLNKADKQKRFKNTLMRTEASDLLAPGPYNIYSGMYL